MSAAAALALLDELGAGDIAHPGGDLRSHLVRTHDTLRAWAAPDDVCLAGLIHAAYGTDGFPLALLPLDDRPRLRSLIGVGAEAIVYRYCSCSRTVSYAQLGQVPWPLTDRFTGDVVLLSEDEAAAFAVLTIANERDIVQAGGVDATGAAAIARLSQALRPYCRVEVPDEL
jgi:hypothetical protein